ncbi:hypothetical protein BDC45DRAFT_529598 [Circinella umbellata]|nr:hypothetical protein BDC45DRAFT_529598 [Circinella umbellata]
MISHHFVVMAITYGAVTCNATSYWHLALLQKKYSSEDDLSKLSVEIQFILNHLVEYSATNAVAHGALLYGTRRKDLLGSNANSPSRGTKFVWNKKESTLYPVRLIILVCLYTYVCYHYTIKSLYVEYFMTWMNKQSIYYRYLNVKLKPSIELEIVVSR